MSTKSFIQILLILLIISTVTTVYLKYFDTNKDIVEEINSIEIENQDKINRLEEKLSELELKNTELKKIIEKKENDSNLLLTKDVEKKNIENNEINKKKVDLDNKSVEKKMVTKGQSDKNSNIKIDNNKDLVKDIEYNSIDSRGNNFYLLAKSGKSNVKNKNVLDLVDVRGEITSNNRDTIYIVSDLGEFNSINSNSKFYDNVIINYQDKQINCENFDLNMETNKAIAYNDVIITDVNSEMKAGLVEFDLKTRDININPQSANTDIEVVTN